MNKKLLIMGGIAVVFGGLSIIAADFWLKNNVKTVVETVEVPAGPASGAEFSTIVVAGEPLRYGTVIDPGMLKELPWPKNDLPMGSFSKIEELLSTGERVALTAIDTNEPILVSKVTDPNNQATLSRRIEDGKRAVTVRVDDITGVAGFVVPGDRVDVALTRTFKIKKDGGEAGDDVAPIDVSPAGDRTFTGDPDSFVATTVVLTDIKVLSIDQIADERQSTPVVVRAVTLEVDSFGAKTLASAQEAGTLSLLLRRAGDVAADDQFIAPMPAIDISPTASFTAPAAPPPPTQVIEAPFVASGAKVTVWRKSESQTYDVRDEGAVK